jgi:3-methyl-2-oxobutanoate hydroxymethyltransferase
MEQPSAGQAAGGGGRVTIGTLAKMAAAGTPFACLTCYDATMARWLERGGVPVLLVGDTAAEVVLGYERTIDMPLEVLLALTAGVKRGAPSRLVMGDMPFGSYHADDAEGVRNAARFLTQGLADVVKVEADRTFAPMVSKMVRAGIPICGHVGSRPQRAAVTGGYASAGRTAAEAERIVEDAVALEDAGCQLLLVEAVPPEVTERILARTQAPLIGIGAGPACHGQVLVLQDLLGMSDRTPRFAEPVDQLGRNVQLAGEEWVRRVAERRIGGHGYTMRSGEGEKLGRVSGAGPDRTKPDSTNPERISEAGGSAAGPESTPGSPPTTPTVPNDRNRAKSPS